MELHSAFSSVGPSQETPPFFLGMAISRNRLISPPPQILEHLVHSVHSDHWQSRGQPWVLQKLDSSESPEQGRPPKVSSGDFTLLRDMVPVSQVLEQRVYLLQLDHWQSTGQGCSLQLSVFSLGGPPKSFLVSHSKPPH